MRKMLGLVAIFALGACSIGKDLPLATAKVAEFHQRLNNGAFAEIASTSAVELKSDPKFVRLLTIVNKKLGREVDAKQIGWNDNVTTGGRLVVLNFQTKFEHGDATENFTFRVEGNRPVLAGWHINSDALIYN